MHKIIPEETKAYRKRWREENKEKLKEYQKDWYQRKCKGNSEHTQKVKAYYQKRKEDPEFKRQRSLYEKKRKKENPDLALKKKEYFNLWCKENPEKVREWGLKKKFNLSYSDFYDLLLLQDKKCAICGSDISQKACVDHSHSSGKIRGLLCSACNLGLGIFKENVKAFKRAIQYLETNLLEDSNE